VPQNVLRLLAAALAAKDLHLACFLVRLGSDLGHGEQLAAMRASPKKWWLQRDSQDGIVEHGFFCSPASPAH
jgi:hypothetical protein